MDATADHRGRKAEPTTRHVDTAHSQPEGLLGIEHETPSINAKPISAAAILTAIGIVYGDLGTSPLYVFPAIASSSGGSLDEATALGSMSLIFWALIVVISVKYCLIVMRADNHGEGGILALMSLTRVSWRGRKRIYLMLGLLGAALLYGDGVITPSISVLSAVEGLNVATKTFAPYTTIIAVAILLALFLVQRFGTEAIGKTFGPIMLLWFVSIAIFGLVGIAQRPSVLVALYPSYGFAFLVQHGLASFAVLGAIFLALTGAEAMYADMGHIGRNPIRLAWYVVVLPALLLNYLGQTAMVLAASAHDPKLFFVLAPDWALYPLVGLATVATIIASQAIITGVFSLTRQAMQLGWLPPIRVRQTSAGEYGQIYIPLVNWTMMAATLALIFAFGTSDRLAGAYGTAVATTTVLTTALLYRVMRVSWRWPALASLATFVAFVVVDLIFFSANLLKIVEGGWFPLLLGALIFTIMSTWRTGGDAMHRMQYRDAMKINQFRRKLRDNRILRVPGCAIFLTRLRQNVPPLIVDHIRQMGSLYEHVVMLTVRFSDRPRIGPHRRLRIEKIGDGVWHMTIRFGFIEAPNVPKVLGAAKPDRKFSLEEALVFSERDRVVSRKFRPRLWRWQRALFSLLYRNSIDPSDRFGIAPKNFIQITREIEI
jgi:KUP system potassium uptake protein